MKDLTEFIEEEVERHNQKVYGGDMPQHNKRVLSEVLKKEEYYAKREELPNSNNSHDDF